MITLIDVYQGRADVERYLYVLMAERLEEGDANISHVKMPTMDEHEDFIRRHVYRAWYVIAHPVTGEMLGAASITPNNELGIVISPKHRHSGHAREALIALMAAHPPLPGLPSQRSAHYVANIRPGNAASIALFQSLGFNLLQHTYIKQGEGNARTVEETAEGIQTENRAAAGP
jgi:Acetyltransferases, including N-acetylases of ribosomal proteins